MWLDSKRKYKLIRYEPNDLVVAWVVDVKAYGEDSDQIAEPGVFTVGRLLADELRRFEIAECGEQVWQVADADRSGINAGWPREENSATTTPEPSLIRSLTVAGVPVQ